VAKIIVPEHNYPIRHVAISASQNVYKSSEGMIKKEAGSFIYYLKNNLMPSIKFKRTADLILNGYDENKAMFPIYQNIPLFCITTIAALESGKIVSVVGSHEVGSMVNELKEYYSSKGKEEIASSLNWVPECDGLEGMVEESNAVIAQERGSLTISNSMNRLVGSLNLDKDDAFIFTSGDILFFDYDRICSDKDLINHSLVLDLNGKETINPPFPRNYYHRLRTSDKGLIHFKEPNVWIIGSEFGSGHVDTTYSNAQKGGFGFKVFLKMAARNMLRNPGLVSGGNLSFILSASLKGCMSFFSRKVLKKSYVPVYDPQDIESIAKFLNMSPVKVKAEHDDYLRIKDVDGLHDYIFIRRLLENHCQDIFPSKISESIQGFASYLNNDRVSRINIIREFPEVMMEKIERIEHEVQRRGLDYKIKKPFDNNGMFIAKEEENESLEGAVIKSREYLQRHL
jgi:hypothetical protein